MGKKLRTSVHIISYTLLVTLLAAAVMFVVSQNGQYPSGSDTMCHIYKGNVLYQEILSGNWYPLYDPMWYNGVEMMRYWAPLPVYILALCQAVMGGDPFNGYLLFVGFVFFFGALVWFGLGCHHKRPLLGAVIGILWFFMPNNLYALFGEGNLPRSICMVFLPLFISYLHDYLLNDIWNSIPKMTLCFVLMALCHLGYAGMIALAVIVFLAVYAICNHRQGRKIIDCVVAMVAGFLLIGIWAFASLQGGITSTDSSEVMAGFFQDAMVSLDPTFRVRNGHGVAFYYGLAAFVLGIFGVLFSKKQSRPGFITAIVIFFCTTTTMYSVLVLMPGSQYLWMLRFISIALCFTLYSLFLWRSLRKPFLFLVCLALVIDTLPSFALMYGDRNRSGVDERYHAIEEDALLTDAKAITQQRLTLIDFSSLGATAAYLISGYENAVPATFGAGWQSANTATNIVQLNQATEDGCYLYLFDRCLELGSDTVVIQTRNLHDPRADVFELDACAAAVGYALIAKNSAYRVYHIETPKCFGVRSTYRAIGIGTAAPSISISFPAVKETTSVNLNDYTYEQLSEYDVIYLAGFTYTDKKLAEQMVLDLSESGVKVIIMTDGIPSDEHTGTQTFLGISVYPVYFSGGYPELKTIDGQLNCDLFPDGFTDWRTTYINGLDNVWGSIEENGQRLDFFGTTKNENLVFIGLNLTYHYALTRDAAVGRLLSHALTLSGSELPQRTIVPLAVQYQKNRITIVSEQDDVNTTLAFHDIFSCDDAIYEENHLTFVNSGTTVIKMHYPYLFEGCVVSAVGVVLIILLFRSSRNRNRMLLAEENVHKENASVPEKTQKSMGENYETNVSGCAHTGV